MERGHRPRVAPLATGVAAATLLLLAACSSVEFTGPDVGILVREITLAELEGEMTSRTTRLEIELRPGGVVAREVEVEEPVKAADRESIEAAVTAVEVDGTDGTLVLDLGGLRVDFSVSAAFEDDEGETLSFAAFVDRVQAAVDAGETPRVEAQRAPAEVPQGPDDATFVAVRLEIGDEDEDGPDIEINTDGDNFIANENPPPEAVIRVLGLDVELRIAEGLTELEAKLAAGGRVEFDERVTAVDVAAGAFELADGEAVVRVVENTEIETEDDGEILTSLAEVEAALAEGRTVEADGDGIVVGQNPLTLEAIEIEFEVRD